MRPPARSGHPGPSPLPLSLLSLAHIICMDEYECPKRFDYNIFPRIGKRDEEKVRQILMTQL